MSNGNPINAGEQNDATDTTRLFADWNFASAPICYVGVPINNPEESPANVDGLITRGNLGGAGLAGWGGSAGGPGVIGCGGTLVSGSDRGVFNLVQLGGAGVVGNAGPGRPAYTTTDPLSGDTYGETTSVSGGYGVIAFGGSSSSPATLPTTPLTITAEATPGVGIYAEGGEPDGSQLGGTGIVGIAGGPEDAFPPDPIYQGNGLAGIGRIGVYGYSPNSIGVHAVTEDNATAAVSATGGPIGVLTVPSKGGQGVAAMVFASNEPKDANSAAIFAAAFGGTPGMGPFAGKFVGAVDIEGPVTVHGDFAVMGNKNVVEPFPDGSHRVLYCVESPEAWFEDFGEAKLVKGKAYVTLPEDFATVIKTNLYHVFLTAYGKSNGLYVAKRTPTGFAVEEIGNGKSNLKFSYRIVGKRKSVKSPRFAKVALPAPSKPIKLPAGIKPPGAASKTAAMKQKHMRPKRQKIGVPPGCLTERGSDVSTTKRRK